MSTAKNASYAADTNNNSNARQRFFLGDDSDASDADHSDCDEPSYVGMRAGGGEPARSRPRHFSISSDCSDGVGSVVGGPPTNLNFVIDEDEEGDYSTAAAALMNSNEDSGLGGDDLSSLDEGDARAADSSQIVPMRMPKIGGGTLASSSAKAGGAKRSHAASATPPSRRGGGGGKRRHFHDYYTLKDDHLGSGAYASVSTCVSLMTGKEYAVKLVDKHEPGHTRSRILREVDIFKMCKGHPNFVQLSEWFEDQDHFYIVFEKMYGGPLLNHIQRKVCFTEQEAAMVARDIATALKFLHSKGVAHRDLKPENILCTEVDRVSPVKLCDFDLASKPSYGMKRRASRQLHNVQSEPDLASPVGSAEFLAPEVVETFVGESLKYDRRCDLWSLGVIIYIMLCGYVPFYGECDREECGWNQGKPCDDCQENLFQKIQEGSFDFPAEEWSHISAEAKDLISHLLVKNVKMRYTASDVLAHPWISNAPETPLQTANNLFRNNSSKDIQQFNDHFNFAARLSSRVEEVIPSLGSTPENESNFGSSTLAVPTQHPQANIDELVEKAKQLLVKEQQEDTDSGNGSNDGVFFEGDFDDLGQDFANLPDPMGAYTNGTQMPPPHGDFMDGHGHVHAVPYYAAPPVPPSVAAWNMQLPAPYAQQQAYYYGHQQQPMDGYVYAPPPHDYTVMNGVYTNQQQQYMPPPQAANYAYAPAAEYPNQGEQMAASHQQRNGKMAMQHQQQAVGSHSQLDTCQNAIIRQNSASAAAQMHASAAGHHPQSREAQVNV